MSRRPVWVLFSFVVCHLAGVSAWAQPRQGTQTQGGNQPPVSAEEKARRLQPGATQGGIPTDVGDAQPKFNVDYFVGEWEFEGNLAESPLGAGGPSTGSETVRNVWDGRYWDLTIKGENADGPFTGKGILMYQDSFTGQAYTRYEVMGDVALIRTGVLGCDLGGTCSLHFETPPFERKGSRVQLRGRYTLSSPYSYRLTTEIRVDKEDYRNLGTTWYRKKDAPAPKAIK